MLQADRVFPAGFVQCKPGRAADYPKEGMYQVMTMANHCQSVQVMLRYKDCDPERTAFADVTEVPTKDDADQMVAFMDIEINFFVRWVAIRFTMYGVYPGTE